MNNLRWSLLAALALGVEPAQASAQQIGPVSLPLGSQSETVLRSLREYYVVDDATGLVRSKEGPPFIYVGTVGFRGGRLTIVIRSWNLTRGVADTGVGATVSALSTLDREENCAVRVQHLTTPEDEIKTVEITCGLHAVSLAVGTHEGEPMQASVNETWRNGPVAYP